MILITLFLGTAIALKSDEEPSGMYLLPSKPIYKRPNRTIFGDWSPHIDEPKSDDEKKYFFPIDLYQQSKGYPSSNYFLPARPLLGKPANTLGEWAFNNEKKAYFYPNDLFEQMLASKRLKRDATGALRIQTNNALPIHADVKPVGGSEPAETAVTVTEKVTAPEDTFYEVKSLRKSLLPLPNKLEIARSINRVITIVILLMCAVIEFYPLLDTLFNLAYTFVYL